MTEGNVVAYKPAKTGIDYMADMISNLWHDKKPKRKVVFSTGPSGYKLFTKWMKQSYGKKNTP